MSDTPETLQWPQIVRNAVHDMRTPMSSILMATFVLRQHQSKTSDSECGRMLALLEREVEVLSGCLRRLTESPGSFLTQAEPDE